MNRTVVMHRWLQAQRPMLMHAAKIAATVRKKAKRKSQKVANDIHQAHRAVTAAIQVIQAAMIRQVAANQRHHQVLGFSIDYLCIFFVSLPLLSHSLIMKLSG